MAGVPRSLCTNIFMVAGTVKNYLLKGSFWPTTLQSTPFRLVTLTTWFSKLVDIDHSLVNGEIKTRRQVNSVQKL